MGVSDGCQAPLVDICSRGVDTLILCLNWLARQGVKEGVRHQREALTTVQRFEKFFIMKEKA
jgi:hypothetical protein